MDTDSETSITLTRTIDVPAEELFAAWTDPALLEQWQAEKVSFEPFEGGAFRFETVDADDPEAVHVVSGTVLVYEPESKLVERWHYQGENEDIEQSVLTVVFKDIGEGRTEITLTEEAEAHKDAESRIFSIEAWDAAIGELAELLE
ncbi:SRPBCC family protein [Pelagibacterium xiamenense]|uniref:SRPBCC family protein n=1 Tax=Pelagibacterium xiamenense TaxID=2901140 RepID=UPI001E41703D|nr:SRPBCC domain-containing protein [Pelagibacterium xiamenense]MCD7060891.1 SRPBCC domain-containing protein [Pelagibacterium xiamenense]